MSTQTSPTSTSNPTERMMKILQATPEQLAMVDDVLAGRLPTPPNPAPPLTGPLLLPMGKACELLGVSRPTLWRMLNAGKLNRVEVLPNTYRVRRSEILTLVNGGQGV